MTIYDEVFSIVKFMVVQEMEGVKLSYWHKPTGNITQPLFKASNITQSSISA